jgi:hypothetical protein
MDATVTPPTANEDARTETVVVGSAVALALVVGLGFAAQQAGWLDDLFSKTISKQMGAVVGVIHAEAGGDPQRILLTGSVSDPKTVTDLEKDMKKAFPGSEVRNAVRVDKRITDKKKDIVRVSFAADAPNEAWPRARFGEIKRLEVLYKDEKVMLRGAVFAPTTKKALEDAYESLPTAAKGAIQLREVVRATVSAAELQNSISVAMAGRSVAFDKDGAVDAKDAASAAVLDAVAPLVKDLRGIEILLSAGADDRATALKQAEAVKAALVARGADAAGLRPVPAPKNNPLALIVREKE